MLFQPKLSNLLLSVPDFCSVHLEIRDCDAPSASCIITVTNLLVKLKRTVDSCWMHYHFDGRVGFHAKHDSIFNNFQLEISHCDATPTPKGEFDRITETNL